jgi:hypothetical protein
MKVIDHIRIRPLDEGDDIEIAIDYKDRTILAIWVYDPDVDDDDCINEYKLYRWRYFSNARITIPPDVEFVPDNVIDYFYVHCKIVGVDEV